ncbi:hypothetical protein [Hyalangium minutum]|uniref:Uncharacterized protein n=1 Tax=Hyalangium minutum TaxID=394096 RepID=A0A085VXD7_9BACT|nr:hypothetical protein [Hyalangium minutum]KFE60100.1 hypothetical protein DB31_5971 [Hyalangium minutum]
MGTRQSAKYPGSTGSKSRTSPTHTTPRSVAQQLDALLAEHAGTPSAQASAVQPRPLVVLMPPLAEHAQLRTLTRAAFGAWVLREQAAPEFIRWLQGQQGTPAQLWAQCPGGDRLLWLAVAADVPLRWLVLAACACAGVALPRLAPTETALREALRTVQVWAAGEEVAQAELEAARQAAGPEVGAEHLRTEEDCARYAVWAAVSSTAYPEWALDVAGAAAGLVSTTQRAARLAECAQAVRTVLPWGVVEAAVLRKVGVHS